MDLEISQRDDSSWSGMEACAVATVVRKHSGCTCEASRWCGQGAWRSRSGWPRASNNDGLSYSEEHYFYAQISESPKDRQGVRICMCCAQSLDPQNHQEANLMQKQSPFNYELTRGGPQVTQFSSAINYDFKKSLSSSCLLFLNP